MIIQYILRKASDTITETDWGWFLMSALIIIWAITQMA
jgi:hypothetical protein